MALRHAVMAVLLDGEASGYELSKFFDASVANFWTATSQQLYLELKRLEEKGLLSSRVVEQEKRPNKRLFSLTRAGLEELAAFTAKPPKPTAIRDELLVKVQAVDRGDLRAVIDAVADHVERSEAKVALYRDLGEQIRHGLDEDSFLSGKEPVGPYLTLMRGRAFEEENIRWGKRTIEVLERRAANVGSPDQEVRTISR